MFTSCVSNSVRYTLRQYQAEAVGATWDYLINKSGHPLLVLPTGAGKSLIIADLAKGAYEHGRKVLILAHRKELLAQNREKIQGILPKAKIGAYSAGLKSKDIDDDIIVAGIQSCYKKAHEFGERHLVLVDEAHLIPSKDSGMYRQFLSDLQGCCPYFRMVGLTATPYRLDAGRIYGPDDDQMFDAIAYQAEIGRLIDLSLIHISEPTRRTIPSRMPSSA